MMLSLTKKFLFIANLKTASTSIERVLAPHSELRLTQSKFGKHLTFAEFAERFKWLLSCTDINDIFIFGVMRDPTDYILSLYNSHKVDQFRNDSRLYTGNMDFSRFRTEWATKNADQLRPQYSRFISAEGRLVANMIVSFEKLESSLELVATRIGVPELLNLPKQNRSPASTTRDDLGEKERTWIDSKFRKDREFMARHCDRLLD